MPAGLYDIQTSFFRKKGFVADELKPWRCCVNMAVFMGKWLGKWVSPSSQGVGLFFAHKPVVGLVFANKPGSNVAELLAAAGSTVMFRVST